MLWHLILNACASIRQKLLRSVLIVVTVGIGIGAVLATVALTDGLTVHVTANTAKVGRNVSALHKDLLYVVELAAKKARPGKRLRITYADFAALTRGLPTFRTGERDAPVTFVPTHVEYAYVDRTRGGRRARTTLVGTTPAYQGTMGYGLVAGRFLESADVTQARPVCVLDGGSARQFFGGDTDLAAGVGRKITLHRDGRTSTLEVVGVLEEPYALREKFGGFDTVRHARPAIFSRLNLLNLYLPVTLVTDRPDDAGVSIGGVPFVPEASATGMLCLYGDCAEADIQAFEERMRAWADDRDLAMMVLPQWRWLKLVDDLMGQANVAGSVVWMVILGVTAVMILVINLVVVRERFREVAIRRTEGARRLDIVVQFLVESSILSILGGALGLGIGTIAAHVLSENVTGWAPALRPQAFLLASGAALFIGTFATTVPAWQAARLDPVKVLTKR